MTKFDDFALIIEPYITLENALDYERQMDRWIWVIDNITDPAEVRATQRHINWIEDRFDALLKDHEAGILVTLAQDAAPDLLAALETVLLAHRYDGALTNGTAVLSPAIADTIERAITKAKGN